MSYYLYEQAWGMVPLFMDVMYCDILPESERIH
jgi:hypothetical protein